MSMPHKNIFLPLLLNIAFFATSCIQEGSSAPINALSKESSASSPTNSNVKGRSAIKIADTAVGVADAAFLAVDSSAYNLFKYNLRFLQAEAKSRHPHLGKIDQRQIADQAVEKLQKEYSPTPKSVDALKDAYKYAVLAEINASEAISTQAAAQTFKAVKASVARAYAYAALNEAACIVVYTSNATATTAYMATAKAAVKAAEEALQALANNQDALAKAKAADGAAIFDPTPALEVAEEEKKYSLLGMLRIASDQLD
ncbi:MAG: hypothetical protein AAF963_02440 [Bacteroidota bacterium]